MYYMAVVTQRELGRRKSSAGRTRAGARLFAWSPRRTLTLLHFFLYPHFLFSSSFIAPFYTF